MRLIMELITNPQKIIEFPLTIFQMSITFAQSIMKLVV